MFISLANGDAEVRQWGGVGVSYGSKSCEMLAEELLNKLLADFPVESVEVSEDGENGARVERR
jgi:hypothetical protein